MERLTNINPGLINPSDFFINLIKSGKISVDYLKNLMSQLGLEIPKLEPWMVVDPKDPEMSQILQEDKKGFFEWLCMGDIAHHITNVFLDYRNGFRKKLICVKAQHPLLADGRPGSEYENRLRAAFAKGDAFMRNGNIVDFAVVGAVHDGCSTVSLAEAGRQFLIDHYVSDKHIKELRTPECGLDENKFFADLFFADNYEDIFVTVSVGQIERSVLDFSMLGLEPSWITVTQRETFGHQNSVKEMFAPYGVHGYEEGLIGAWKVAEAGRKRHHEEMEKKANNIKNS